MAQKTFATMVSLEKYIESACEKAVQNACNRLLGTLQELIDTEYYDQFEPDYYKRTYQFWESATTKMLNKNCGEIFMDETAMNYGSFWTGELQLLYASEGYHGHTDFQTEGRFWDSFIDFCEKNASKILKEELVKQGLTIK
jgi:hypothetical protein